jgi:GntR family transcriptional regulator
MAPDRRRPRVCQHEAFGPRDMPMEPKWNDTQPIYRQLRDRVVAMILEGVVKDGDALPSVRHVAAEYQLNPLTVMKGYQSLVDEDLVEKKRGRGMYVKSGAKALLLSDERDRFLQEVWPATAATIRRLGLSVEELMQAPAEAVDMGGLGAGAPGAAAEAANDPSGASTAAEEDGANADGGRGNGDNPEGERE